MTRRARGGYATKPITAALLLGLALPLPIGRLAGQSVSARSTTALAFTRVNVVDVEHGRVLSDQTVLILGERIGAVGPSGSVRVPGDAQVVDATGKYLIPGLWDMHTHSGGDELTRTIELPLYVAHGVTGVRQLSGTPGHLRLRAEISEGTLPGPRMVVGSPFVDGPSPWPGGAGEDEVRVPDPGAARRVVDSLWAAGYAFIKTYQFLSPEVYRALHARGRELGMEVSGEIPMSVSLWEAAALGHRTVEHLTGVEFACSRREEELRVEFRRLVAEISADTTLKTHIPVWNRSEWEPVATADAEKCRALYDHLAAHGTWVVPTLVIQHQLSHASDPAVRNDPRARYLPASWWDPVKTADYYDPERRLRPTYEHRMRALLDIHQAGVGILAGSDLSGGFPLHDELRLFVEAGLSPLDALRTATLNPARYLKATDSLGTVAAGRLADLVLLDANPLEDITNVARIHAVVLNGRVLDRAALDALLRKVEEGTAKENERTRSEDPAAQDGSLDTPGSRKAVAEPNDNRQTAGRQMAGELRVELEAVEAEWYPRGPGGPRILTPAFAEPGRAPQVPGPLIRTAAGTPVRVSVRNTLDRAITVRGLLDRATMSPQRPSDADPLDADFFFADSLVVPSGETREVRFTPTSEVSSFYYGRVAPEEGGFAQPFLPGNFGDEGIFLGGLVVDAPATTRPPDERVFLITRWGGGDEPSTLAVTFKFMINGLSWPFTERLDYQVGDTVRWRIINTSVITHPMHLHGFYFTVDARGDTDADTVHALGERQQAVTDLMPDFSALRLTWVPDRPGNWLFHCHLIRHMSALQRFASEVERSTASAEGDQPPRDDHDMHGMHDAHDMAGLVMGLVIRPAGGDDRAEPTAERTVHLWTSRAPGVFDERPEYSFVARDEPGAPPLDTTVVPGSAIVLRRGQPTDIVVHNRLDFPLSVHWHGLEVRSLYDGVAGWSGEPGAVRPAINPGASVRVRITPPRAGTFIYHIHGEAGHELSRGLYGPFLVLPEGEPWNRERDRLFVLAARGAQRDPPPVVNGRETHPPERFEVGARYRLRFIHISPDASKRVRLLRDAAPVTWRPLARDGADLPASAQVPQAGERDIGVGETFDVEWAPDEPGAYTLEVVTTHYSASGLRPTVQRVAFGVGDVTEEALAAAALVEPTAPPAPTPLDTMAVVELDEARLREFVGAYTAPGVPVTFTVSWADGALRMSVTGREPRPLVPLSPTRFRWEDDQTVAAEFEVEDGRTVLVVFGMRLNRQTQ